MGLAEDLAKLCEMHRQGALTDREFVEAKAKLLAALPLAPPPTTTSLLRRHEIRSNFNWGGILHPRM
jgi:hypothetical protein